MTIKMIKYINVYVYVCVCVCARKNKIMKFKNVLRCNEMKTEFWRGYIEYILSNVSGTAEKKKCHYFKLPSATKYTEHNARDTVIDNAS